MSTDAVSAALDILGEIERYNSEHGDPSIILKILNLYLYSQKDLIVNISRPT